MNTPATPPETMPWRDEYATGVAEIDEQHMILVHTLNQAGTRLATESGLDILEQITQDLLSYALYHFDTEEELMLALDYAEADAAAAESHLAQHRAFSSKVLAVREGLKAGTLIAPAELLGFLRDWLVNHILNTDKRLAAHVLARRTPAAG